MFITANLFCLVKMSAFGRKFSGSDEQMSGSERKLSGSDGKMSESDDMMSPSRKRRQPNSIKQKEKLARQRGLEFVSHKGLLVEAKVTGVDCACRRKCMEPFSDKDKRDILNAVYSGRPKNEKDTFLMGLIDRSNVARPIALPGHSKQHSSSFTYFVMKGSTRVNVCRKAFTSLHALSNKAVQRLNKLIETGQSPVDNRGKHKIRGNSIGPTVRAKISGHITSFPKKESHYTTVPVIYLEAGLTVRKMHELFLEKFPDLAEKVKYEFYLNFFKERFGYKFGRPQVDVCSTCEDLNAKIKSTTISDDEKRQVVAELLVHKRRASKFYKKMKEVEEICKERHDVGAIVFDYMQNLPLPLIPVQEMFYLRKLWLNVFNIHDIRNERSVFYIYPEGEGKKGPNEVCSFILDFIKDIPEEVKELHVFSDACAGQNRNHTLTRLLMALTMTGRFKIINQYYPVRGHSFLPCDRNFSVIKRAVRKLDRIYSPGQYQELIRTAKKRFPPFEVKRVQRDSILNFKDWWPQYFKKTCKDLHKTGQTFNLSKYRHLKFAEEEAGIVKASTYIGGLLFGAFKLNKQPRVIIPTQKAYDSRIPINYKKLQDLKKIVHYVPEEYRQFYEELTQWPTTNATESDENNG